MITKKRTKSYLTKFSTKTTNQLTTSHGISHVICYVIRQEWFTENFPAHRWSDVTLRNYLYLSMCCIRRWYPSKNLFTKRWHRGTKCPMHCGIHWIEGKPCLKTLSLASRTISGIWIWITIFYGTYVNLIRCLMVIFCYITLNDVCISIVFGFGVVLDF